MSTVPTDPTTANVYTGLDIVLTCTARGAPEPTFAWFRGDTELTGSDMRVTITPGPTSEAAPDFVTVGSTLTITGSLGTDAGAYSCVASNTVFSETRSDTVNFTLTINCEFSVFCVCMYMYMCVYIHFICAVSFCSFSSSVAMHGSMLVGILATGWLAKISPPSRLRSRFSISPAVPAVLTLHSLLTCHTYAWQCASHQFAKICIVWLLQYMTTHFCLLS